MKSATRVLIFVLGVLACPVLSEAQQTRNSAPSQIIRKDHERIYPQYYSLAWMKEVWSGDEKPYTDARLGIDGLLRSKTLVKEKVDSFKSLFLKDKNNPLKLFKWIYAETVMPNNQDYHNKMMSVVREYYWTVPSPLTYQYARLRWIATAESGPLGTGDIVEIRQMGEKLLRKNGNDYYVLYYLVNYSDVGLAEVYAKRMVVLEPKKQSAHSTLAYVYFLKFLKSHSQRDADIAIAAYEEYRAMLPASDKAGRKSIDRTIEHIRHVRARAEKQARG